MARLCSLEEEADREDEIIKRTVGTALHPLVDILKQLGIKNALFADLIRYIYICGCL